MASISADSYFSKTLSYSRLIFSSTALPQFKAGITYVVVDFSLTPKRNYPIIRSQKSEFYQQGTSIHNTEIGDLFGGLSYSEVSKVNTRFSEKLR